MNVPFHTAALPHTRVTAAQTEVGGSAVPPAAIPLDEPCHVPRQNGGLIEVDRVAGPVHRDVCQIGKTAGALIQVHIRGNSRQHG